MLIPRGVLRRASCGVDSLVHVARSLVGLRLTSSVSRPGRWRLPARGGPLSAAKWWGSRRRPRLDDLSSVCLVARSGAGDWEQATLLSDIVWQYGPVLLNHPVLLLGTLEGTAGLLLAPAEGFGLRPRLFLLFGQKKAFYAVFA